MNLEDLGREALLAALIQPRLGYAVRTVYPQNGSNPFNVYDVVPQDSIAHELLLKAIEQTPELRKQIIDIGMDALRANPQTIVDMMIDLAKREIDRTPDWNKHHNGTRPFVFEAMADVARQIAQKILAEDPKFREIVLDMASMSDVDGRIEVAVNLKPKGQ